MEIENFRGIKYCLVDDLRLVNVFIGPNNSGKSTLLDAVYWGLREPISESTGLILKGRSFRKVERPELFYDLDEKNEISVQLEFDRGAYSLRVFCPFYVI